MSPDRMRSRSGSRTPGVRTTRTSRGNADLYQNYTTNATTGLPLPSTVTLLATPSHWQDRLNANLGIYGQDVLTFKRATHHAGRPLRVHQRAGHRPGRRRSAASSNIPAFGDIKMPTWKMFSPRTSIVYDLMGNGKTAVRFGYNRFGVGRDDDAGVAV